MRGSGRGRAKNKNRARGKRIVGIGGSLALAGLALGGADAAAQVSGISTGVPALGPGGTGAVGATGGGGIATGIGGFGAAPGAFTTPFAAYGLPPAPATAPPPPAVTPLEIPSVPPAWRLVPAIELGEAFTDNVNLAPPGARQSDFITTITPSLTLTGQTAHLNLDLTYAPQLLLFARTAPTSVLQQRLSGTGRAELWSQTLFVEGAASIAQAYARNTGPVAPTTLTTNNNLQTVYTETASPYLLQHFGTFADSESRYRFTSTSTSATTGASSDIAPEITHELRQTLLGGELFGRLGWQALGDYTRLERGQATGDPFSGTTAKDTLLRTDLKYPVYKALSAIGGIGYERITDPSLTTQPKGVIWDVGLTYQPNPLVAATLTYGKRFDRTDIEFNAAYNLDPQLSLNAIYTQTIQTGQSLIAGGLLTNTATNTNTGANPTTGTAPPPTTIGANLGTSPSFGLTSGAFIAKTGEVAATLTKERNTYGATLYESKVSGNTTLTGSAAAAAATVTAERLFGGFVTWDHLLKPDLTSNASAGYYRALFLDGSGRHDNVYTISIGLTYNLSRNASATLSLSRSDQQSNIPADTLVVDIIMATVRKEF
jgi:uncharacterized protein (PEP-CTERM system associated)